METDLHKAKLEFRAALRTWADLAPGNDVEEALLSPLFVQLLMNMWSRDALVANWGGRSRGLPRSPTP